MLAVSLEAPPTNRALVLVDINDDGSIRNAVVASSGDTDIAAFLAEVMQVVVDADLDSGVFCDSDGKGLISCADGEFFYSTYSAGSTVSFGRMDSAIEFDYDLDGEIDDDDLAEFALIYDSDLTTIGATLHERTGLGIPDGVVDLDDLSYFLELVGLHRRLCRNALRLLLRFDNHAVSNRPPAA
ncbi:MAG: hypothetical protein AAGB51_00495 [Planctomycetota bacterium]